MFMQSVRIKNLRAYLDETINLETYTCLVGANGAGKSTVLCALNIFFRETESANTNLSSLEKEDFHRGDTDTPIEITITFSDLSKAAKLDFAEYCRQDVLIVTARAEFDTGIGSATVKQYGNRLAMADFAPYFRLLGDGARVVELQTEYGKLREVYPALPAVKVKDAMTTALREYEATRPGDCILIPSEDQFYGVSHGQGLLRKYLQWVYVPAVKDAAGEQSESRNSALGRLLARTVRAQVNFSEKLGRLRIEAEDKYKEMLVAEQGALDAISQALQGRLAEWSHPEATAKLVWHQDPRTSVRIEEPLARLLAGDGEFEGSIARFGHGLQRSYIIALLQGLAATDDEESPRLILGCEEPELYQHPPQARHLANVLQTLSEKNSQVIVCTHSPYLIDGSSFARVRVVRKLRNDGRATVRSCSIAELGAVYAEVTGDSPVAHDAVLVKLHQVMQPHLSEMFFAPKLILVEGLEDAAYLNAWLVLSGRWEAFRARSAHIVAVNGKSELIRPAIIAAKMEIPAFLIFDCDADKLTHKNPDTEKSIRGAHERDNRALFRLAGKHDQEPFPEDPVWGNSFAAWPFDLAHTVKADAMDHWDAAGSSASATFGGIGGLQKNTLHIGGRLKELQKLGANTATLDRLCEAIVAFASQP
ncbi:AAA family ATPase [Mycobacterium sp. KBS0706]|uniref:ATP-dependent nuclease n=1 Tax=Mycobacterium sp. KBS0706 TaxID=2578109 RepID=UPI00163D6DBC|nr:AAA family ATPase [Mycobacterium sp. KBS0706]